MFYTKVKQLCSANNIALCTVVRKLGLSKGSTIGWKNGALPNTKAVIAIAKYFDVTTDSLIMDEPSERSNHDTNS